MNLFPFPTDRNYLARVFALLLSLMSLAPAHAAPTIVSTVPPSGATSVPLAATLVITFSEAMNTSVTMAYLFAANPYELLPASLSWSAGNTVLTCTPDAALPASREILWAVINGQNPAGSPLSGYTGGTFTTISASQLTLTNAIWSGGTFAFDVISPVDQTLTVEYSSTLRSNQWQSLLTTNSPSGRVHIVDPYSSSNAYRFYRARTGSASASQLTLTNAIWSGGTFAFDVISAVGQTLTVEYSSALRSNQWQTLLTTDSPTGRVHIVDPNSSTNAYRFYRARTGS